MSGEEHVDDRRGAGRPTRHGATDFMSRHEAAEGHGDHREQRAAEVSRELNAQSDFVQGLVRHAREHPSRLPAPDEVD